MNDYPHVALIVETSKVYGREILLGISRYVRHHGPWSIFTMERGQDDPDPPWLRNWHGQGIITRSKDLKLCELAARRGIPVVSLRHLLTKPKFPTVFPDQPPIGERIATHLLERGFVNFGYCGVADHKQWERIRREAFTAAIAKRDLEVKFYKPTYYHDSHKNWEKEQKLIGEWILSLDKPVGIMASHDSQGVQLLDACRRVNVRVPDDVAVVSVDNDPVLCELAAPPLSSLDQNVQTIGYEAAALLNRMMGGDKVPAKNYFFDPGEVQVRQSSDVLALEDKQVVAGVKYIRDHAFDKELDVQAIAKAAVLSRRSLEQRFLMQIGISPMEQVHQIRLRRIKQLLLQTNYTLAHIAEIVGFEYTEYMSRFFKKRTGKTPGSYRKEHR
jgi:LacI family transcriptional regulator